MITPYIPVKVRLFHILMFTQKSRAKIGDEARGNNERLAHNFRARSFFPLAFLSAKLTESTL